MKVLILLPLVFAVAHGGAVIRSYGAQCARDTGISRRALELIRDEKLPSSEDQVYENYIFCILKKLGFITNEGEIRTDTDGLETWLSAGKAKEMLEEVKSVCGNQKDKTPTEAAILLYRCILTNDI